MPLLSPSPLARPLGAVFIANGLQLILAVLLIVLGLNIVFHSFKAYKNAEQNSEAKV